MRSKWARPRSTFASFVAIAVACASFAGQIATLQHFALERHVVCQEHGELEDVPFASEATAVHGDAATIGAAAALETRRGHEHCAFASHARQASSAGTAHISCAPAPRPPASPLAALAPPPAPLPVLYRLAPKTSPPRAI
jgi:hypothetical protein